MAVIGEMKKLTIGGSTYTIPEYNLPIASASTLGGVKIGTGLSINSTTGVLSATGLDYSEEDPVFSASAAAGITQTDIDGWNAKVSDTKTWGDVVAPSSRGDTSDNRYIPQFSATSSTSATTASFILTRVEPFALGVPKWDNSKYLYAATPSANDNSTKVATTEYVDGAISTKIAGVLSYKGTKATVADVAAITSKSIGDVWHVTADGSEWAYDGNAWQELGTAIDLSNYALTSAIPTKTSELTNDSGFITTDSDRNVKQTNETASTYAHPVLIGYNVGNTEVTAQVFKDFSHFSYTPSTGNLAVTKLNNYTPAAAMAKAVDTSISAASTSANLPTSAAVAAFVEGKGYLTSYTETDPTVPSWAKASTKPTYTASEVGALPDTTVIPSKTSDLTNDSGFITSYTDEKVKAVSVTNDGNMRYLIFGGSSGNAETKYYHSGLCYSVSSTNQSTLIIGNGTYKGVLRLGRGGGNSFYVTIDAGTPTANRTITLPDKTGTIALTSDLSDTKVTNTAVIDATTLYLTGSTSSSTETGTLGKHSTAKVVLSQADDHTNGATQLWLGNNKMSGADTGAKRGQIYLYSTTSYYTLLQTAVTVNQTITFPNKTGTVALTSDIPTVPTNISAFTNDSGYITSADVPEGASAYTGTISAVTSGNASAGSNNGFARGDHTHNITKTTIDTVLGTGSGTAKFYREDGTWVTPAYPTTYSLGMYGTSGSSNSTQWLQPFDTKMYFKAGDNMGLTKDGNKIIFNAIVPSIKDLTFTMDTTDTKKLIITYA